jgi:gliding motility-associated-like protein
MPNNTQPLPLFFRNELVSLRKITTPIFLSKKTKNPIKMTKLITTLAIILVQCAVGFAQTNTTFYCHFPISSPPQPFAGTAVAGGFADDDAIYGPFNIGFTFNFFGTNYTQYYVGTNGWVGFSAGQPTTYTGLSIPNTNPDIPKNCVMGPWEDWDPSAGTGPFIFTDLIGTAPNRQLVVSWNDCPMFQCNNLLGKFQIILYEGTNWIDNHLINKPSCPTWVAGSSIWGLHNDAGTLAYVVNGQNGAPWTINNTSIRYVPELDVMTYTDQDLSDNLSPSIKMPCSSNLLKITLNSAFLCSTIDNNATNFRFFDPDNIGVGLDSSYTNCNALGYGDTIYVRIADQLYKEGTYTLYSKRGDDGNSVLGNCKDDLEDLDTLYVNVENCYNYDKKLKLLNVTVQPNNLNTKIFWAMPQGFNATYFDSYELYKNDALNSPNFTSIAKKYNMQDTTSIDGTINPSTEDRAYRVVLNLNVSNKKTPPSDTIANILLLNPDAQLPNQDIAATTATLTWNDYWGWVNNKYKIQETQITDPNNLLWNTIDSTTANTYIYTKQKQKGSYAVRVSTTRNNTGKYDSDTAVSNYLIYQVPVRDVTIPDIFTPNGDNINENFVIKNLEFYPNAQLTIHNRWGSKVYETNDYKNDWNGDNHTAGIYYYTLKIKDLDTKSGAVKIVH